MPHVEFLQGIQITKTLFFIYYFIIILYIYYFIFIYLYIHIYYFIFIFILVPKGTYVWITKLLVLEGKQFLLSVT